MSASGVKPFLRIVAATIRRLFSSAVRTGADCFMIHLLVSSIVQQEPRWREVFFISWVWLMYLRRPPQSNEWNTHPGERSPARHLHSEDMSLSVRCSQSAVD